MGKVYEAAAKSRLITSANGVKIRFEKVVLLNGTVIGMLNSADPSLARTTRLKPEEIEAIVERQYDFGTGGIWPQSERLEKDSSNAFGKIRENLKALGEAELRKKIAAAGIPVPVKASLDDLAGLALEAMAKGARVKAAPVADEPPQTPPAKLGKRGDAGHKGEEV
jgi:hypothetical protein